ncbi:MAG: DUF2752 domain-containing protein [Kiritimatiellia bacterium]
MRFERKEAGWKECREWLVFLASLSLAAVALAGLHFCGVQLCLFHRFTGLPCPVCGSSRAVIMLLNGNFSEAFLLQPLASAAMPLAALLFSGYAYMLFFRGVAISVSFSEWERAFIFSALLLLLAVNWLYLIVNGVT